MYSSGVSFVPDKKAEVSYTRTDHIHEKYPQPKNYGGFLGAIYKELYWMTRYVWHIICFEWEDSSIDDMDVTVTRYKPESIASLCGKTKFSKKELQVMYRGFKQGCPNGLVTIEQFKDIYAQFFPQGGNGYEKHSGKYAKFVFNTFDRDGNEQISFEEFVVGLSILSRGSVTDKLEWIFRLYDIKKQGHITREELHTVVSSVYDMMGKNSYPPIDKWVISGHVTSVFEKMDVNRDGIITKAEFIQACLHDDTVCKTLDVFDTIF